MSRKIEFARIYSNLIHVLRSPKYNKKALDAAQKEMAAFYRSDTKLCIELLREYQVKDREIYGKLEISKARFYSLYGANPFNT